MQMRSCAKLHIIHTYMWSDICHTSFYEQHFLTALIRHSPSSHHFFSAIPHEQGLQGTGILLSVNLPVISK